MRVGVPKETKNSEYRVGLTPAIVAELARHGHEVLVERGAGVGAGIRDGEYEAAGARLADTAAAVFGAADMIVKVKEPTKEERKLLRKGQVLFTYLHLAADAEQTRDLLASGATCIAYETVTAPDGGLPLLTPMSEVAGRLAPQVGAHCLEKAAGGSGTLLGGVPGVAPAEVVILGGGVSGSQAATIAAGMGASVTVLDRSAAALRHLSAQFGTSVRVLYSTSQTITDLVPTADLLIGAVLVPGAAAPRLVTREMIGKMKSGSVFVDIAIDQGGCAETSRPTTHANPTYVVDGVLHYCVTNMPGTVPRTSTFALSNATSPFILSLADNGWKAALRRDPHLRNGLNVHDGKVTYGPVATQHGLTYFERDLVLGH